MSRRLIFGMWPALLLACAVTGFGQGPDAGVVKCREGKYDEALPLLEPSTKGPSSVDAEAWNCLALAYIQKKDLKAARKAADRSANLSPATSAGQSLLALTYVLLHSTKEARNAATKAIAIDASNASAYIYRGFAFFQDGKLDDAESDADAGIRLNECDPKGYLLKSRIMVSQIGRKVLKSEKSVDKMTLESAVEMLKTGIDRTKGRPDHAILEDEYNTLQAFQDYFKRDSTSTDLNAPPDPDVTPIKILTKPGPHYTDDARIHNISGKIQLLVLFGATGRVEQVLPLNRLGGGLEEQAMLAASHIKFEPMKRNGHPVAVVKRLEYTFSIY